MIHEQKNDGRIRYENGNEKNEDGKMTRIQQVINIMYKAMTELETEISFLRLEIEEREGLQNESIYCFL